MIAKGPTQRLASSIGRLPRLRLAHLPTPLDEAPRLSQTLGGIRILFKRDDMTELALSGNKTRMFEFSLAQALADGADTVVYGASVQSNYCRQLALACNKLGLETHLILYRECGDEDLRIQGNLLLDLLAGAEVEIVDAKVRRQSQLVKAKAESLRQEGRRVYVPRSTRRDRAIQAIGYVNCALELYEQVGERAINVDYVVVASEDTTQAGFLVGSRALDVGWQVIGINPFISDGKSMISKIANDVSDILGLGLSFERSRVSSTTDYVGRGHGWVTPEGLEALKLVARMEAILLDPVYSSKAMAGLIDLVSRGTITPDNTVIFLHTGGFPAVFAYARDLRQILQDPLARAG